MPDPTYSTTTPLLVPPTHHLVPPLHGYQLTAVNWLRTHDHSALFLDMGLGKTAISVTALQPRHLPALVIAPKRVAENTWPAELDLWRPDLSYAVAAGDPAARQTALQSGADVVIISRDNLRSVPVSHGFNTIIIDELSSFKNRGSKRWSLARKLVKGVPHVWGLTGTPAPNSLLEVWPQMFLVDGGASLGTSITEFRHRWFSEGNRLPSGVVLEWNLRPGAELAIYDLLKPRVMSMLGETHLDLPPVTYNSLSVPLPPRALAQIKSFKRDMVLDIDLLGTFTAENAAVLSGKLRQLSSGFLYHDDAEFTGHYSVIHSAKIDAIEEIVEAQLGSPILIFYMFRAEAEILRGRFPAARDICEPGVIEEWNAGNVPVLLAHPESAGHGLNLQRGGHTVVWFSMPWSSEHWEQGNARLIRQGQTHPVVVHTLVSPGTVDSHVRRVVEGKVSAQQALMEYLEEK